MTHSPNSLTLHESRPFSLSSLSLCLNNEALIGDIDSQSSSVEVVSPGRVRGDPGVPETGLEVSRVMSGPGFVSYDVYGRK